MWSKLWFLAVPRKCLLSDDVSHPTIKGHHRSSKGSRDRKDSYGEEWVNHNWKPLKQLHSNWPMVELYDNTTVLHSYKYNAWELTPWSTRVGNNIKSFCFSKPPPPPPQSHVSFVTAYCRSLPLIAQSVHYNAFDTQLKEVSARKHRSHIFLVYSYPIQKSRINI